MEKLQSAIRQDLWNSQKEQIRGLSARALDVLQEDLESENLRLRQAAAVHNIEIGSFVRGRRKA